MVLLAAVVALAAATWSARRQAALGRIRLETRQEQFTVLAHELKTPLTLIMATTEILQTETSGPLTGDQRMFLREIDQSTARLLLFADNVLTESKLDAGVFTPSMAPTDVRDVVREVWRSMRRLAEQHDQQIEIDYPATMDLVNADAALLRQAIVNLVQNAIRHTSAHGVVGLRAFQNEQEVVVAVWDDGTGMSPVERRQSFKRFVSHTGGSGLGLTIVDTIAKLHGGSVLVDTTMGKGAAFLLVLPRVRS